MTDLDDEALSGRRTIRRVALVVGLVLVGFFALLATRDVQRNQPSFAIVGEVAPPVAGTSYDGRPFDLEAVLADRQWVVVNFFASWCTPCITENPELIEFSRRHAGGDVVLVGVAMDDTADDVAAFFDRYGGDWPVIVGNDTTNGIVVDYGIQAPPSTLIIRPDGRVVDMLIGATTADQLDGLLAEAGWS